MTARKMTCTWTELNESCADTECGHVFNNWPSAGVLQASRDYAGEEAFMFCPYCGKPIVIKPKKDEK